MSQELHLSTCIQLRMTKHPSRKIMNSRHLLGCDTIAVIFNLFRPGGLGTPQRFLSITLTAFELILWNSVTYSKIYQETR